ncbi:MAG: NUDIX domain-containing protein [Candidatus Kapabacteria bacterium]|nr:NUDIX domain-containing protein [Candidatus Kapabacteria bacterium]
MPSQHELPQLSQWHYLRRFNGMRVYLVGLYRGRCSVFVNFDQDYGMNFEPQKFFIGLMDFFSILLPGAILSFILMDDVGPILLGQRYARLTGSEAWTVFLFASYLLGHITFLLGSWLDLIYDWLRTRTLNRQIEQVARNGRLLFWPLRVCIAIIFKRERDKAVDAANMLKKRSLGDLKTEDAVNAFQWSKAYLNLNSPQSMTIVQRFEADSKFFRCFTIVLLILIVSWPWHSNWSTEGVIFAVLLLPLAVWRYMEQRHKSTNQAYWSVMTLIAPPPALPVKESVSTPQSVTHAGGVVMRTRRGRSQVLLVESKDDPNQLVLPKGKVETGEKLRETAVREVHEETGVWASIVHDMGELAFMVDGKEVKTRFFAMKAIGRGIAKDRGRKKYWLEVSEAIGKVPFPETRELLKNAAASMKST